MGPFAPFIAIALALGAAFDDLWAFVSGGDSALERLLRFIGMTSESIESARQAVRDLIDALADLWDFITGKGEMPGWLKGLQGAGGSQLLAQGGYEGDVEDPDDPMAVATAASRRVAARDRARKAAPPAAAAAPPATNYRAGDAARPAGGNVTNNRSVTTNVSQVTINTQATDAPGIARDFSGELQNQTAQADGALGA